MRSESDTLNYFFFSSLICITDIMLKHGKREISGCINDLKGTQADPGKIKDICAEVR